MSVNDFQYNFAAPSVPNEHVIFTDLDGLEGVLVDLNTKKYYQLNETASLIWRGLEKRLPVDHIAKEMTERYDVTLAQATSSIETALRRFHAQKLLRPSKIGNN
ncbi:MAG: PqqD family protein [Acidobacteriota bacterium]